MDTQIVAGSGLRRACTPATVPTVPKSPQPPRWVKPQLTRLVDEAPAGSDWLHEIKYDSYRMHARLDGGKAQLLTRTGLDRSKQYCFIVEAPQLLPVKLTYLDGEPCALACYGLHVVKELRIDEPAPFYFLIDSQDKVNDNVTCLAANRPRRH